MSKKDTLGFVCCSCSRVKFKDDWIVDINFLYSYYDHLSYGLCGRCVQRLYPLTFKQIKEIPKNLSLINPPFLSLSTS